MTVTKTITAANKAAQQHLPFHDTRDFDDAARGHLGRLDPEVVHDEDGQVVWDNTAYAFLGSEAPDSVHPSLWRQGRLVSSSGLYEVVEGVYQVRGLDLSNITFVEGERGVIVIDPLISVETARARARALSRPPGRPAGDRGHLHPLPRRPLRGRQGGAAPGTGPS